MPMEGNCLSKNAYLLLTAVALSATSVYAGDCPGRCRRSSFLQGRCVYDLIRRDCKKKQECVYVVECKPTCHPVASCPPKHCCKQHCSDNHCGKKCNPCGKSGLFSRMGHWLREDPCQPKCGHVKKKCCGDGATFYT